MAEFEIAPGRTLISVNMGKGYEQYNDPQKAVEFLRGIRESLNNDIWMDIHVWDVNFDPDTQGSLNTVSAEIHWLEGDDRFARYLMSLDARVIGKTHRLGPRLKGNN